LCICSFPPRIMKAYDTFEEAAANRALKVLIDSGR
jgi:hypothetical protein